MTTNYANKRVEIKSKEHLDHVIEVTGMEFIAHFYETVLVAIHLNPVIVFGVNFQNNNDDWWYDYIINDGAYDYSTLESEEIFIDLPSKSEQILDNSDLDNKLNELWLEYLASISESISEIRPKDLAKDFAKFTLDKMEK